MVVGVDLALIKQKILQQEQDQYQLLGVQQLYNDI